MKPLTSVRLSIRISLIVTVVFTVSMLVCNSISTGSVSFTPTLMAIPFFFITYTIYKRSIDGYLFARVKSLSHILLLIKNNKKKVTQELLENHELLSVESDLIKIAQQNKAEIERLNEIENYRRNYVGNVAHEIKTPVFSIQGYLSTLLDGGIDDPTINMKYIERAVKSTDRIAAIIDDLDQITQFESGVIRLNYTTFNLNTLLQEVIDSMDVMSHEHQIKIVPYYERKEVIVSADREKIRQVFTNLIVNAIKYSEKNTEVSIRFFDLYNQFLVEVSDQGIGIAEEHISRLFERFYRVDAARARKTGGTGLGLAIVKHIVEAHEQSITVSSTEGIGTTFSFSLKKG